VKPIASGLSTADQGTTLDGQGEGESGLEQIIELAMA